MKIHRGPFIKTALLDIGILLGLMGVSFGIQALYGIVPGRMPAPEDIPPVVTTFGCIADLIFLLLLPLLGAAYAWFAKREDLDLSPTEAAFGGGLSGAPGFLLSMIGSITVASLNASYLADTFSQAGASITTSTIMLFYTLCAIGGLIIFMLISALGAFVYQSILRKRSSKEAVPSD